MNDVLPPNATRLERRLAATNARIDDVPTPLATLMNPDAIRSDLLPWLAWHLGVDAWKDYWPEYVKRARVGRRFRSPAAGTAAAVREVVAPSAETSSCVNGSSSARRANPARSTS